MAGQYPQAAREIRRLQEQRQSALQEAQDLRMQLMRKSQAEEVLRNQTAYLHRVVKF